VQRILSGCEIHPVHTSRCRWLEVYHLYYGRLRELLSDIPDYGGLTRCATASLPRRRASKRATRARRSHRAAETLDVTLAERTWVLITESPDGGWGINGHANTGADIVDAARRELVGTRPTLSMSRCRGRPDKVPG
jgi:hypothetical protein